MDVLKRDGNGNWYVEHKPKFQIGDQVGVLQDEIHGRQVPYYIGYVLEIQYQHDQFLYRVSSIANNYLFGEDVLVETEREDKKNMARFEVGEKVRFLKDHSIRQIVEIDGGFYRFVGNPTFYPELYLEKLKEEKKMEDIEDCVWDRHVFAREYKCEWKQRRPHPKKMLDDLGIEKVILSEKRGKAVTYVELKDGRKGKATQDIKDTPDPYVGIAIATLSAMTGSKVNFRNMVDFLVKKGQYLRK